MKRLLVLLTLMMLAIALIPGVAAAAPPRVGQRLNLYPCGWDQDLTSPRPCILPFPDPEDPESPAEPFPANTPFHISGGYSAEPGEALRPGQFDFRLFVDGREMAGPIDISWTKDEASGERLLYEARIFNFRKGLPAGEHEFFGIWTQPDFANPGEVIVHTITATVVFG